MLALVYGSARESSARVPHVFKADAAGLVRLDIPSTDPVIAQAQPDERLFNVHAVVFDGGPGVAETQLAAIPYVLNLGHPAWPDDPTGLDGTVVRLQLRDVVADVTGPVKPGGEPIADLLGAPHASVQEDAAPECVMPFGVFFYICTETLFPQLLQNVPVPVIENASAGADFRMSYDFETSDAAITSKLVGTDGLFVEVKRSTTVEQRSTLTAGISRTGVRGGTTDGRVRIATQFKRERIAFCNSLTGTCKWQDVVAPYRMIGTVSTESAPSRHDQLRPLPSLDCANYVSAGTYWDNTQGTTNEMAFTVGLDIQADVKIFQLHATATITKQNETTHEASIGWRVPESGLSYPHHYLFVPDGVANYDQSKADGGACPINAPARTYTDASHEGNKSVDAPRTVFPGGEPAEVKPVFDAARRCQAAPERCGQGV